MCTRCRQDVCLSCKKEKQRGTDMTGNYSLRTSDLEILGLTSHLKKKKKKEGISQNLICLSRKTPQRIRCSNKNMIKKLRKINMLV